MLSLSLESIPMKKETFDYVSYDEVLQAELDCLEAQQTVTNFINFGEIIFSIKKHSSQECIAFASDLLGLDIPSLEAVAGSPSKFVPGFVNRIKEAWKKLCELIHKFLNWISRIISNIIEAIKEKLGKKKKSEDKSSDTNANQNASSSGGDNGSKTSSTGDGPKASSAGNDNGPNNNSEKTQSKPGPDSSDKESKNGVNGVTLSFGDNITKLCAKSENLGTANTDRDIKPIEEKVNRFSSALDSYSTSSKTYNDIAAINKYCLMIKKVYNNIYMAAESINRIFDNLDATKNKKAAGQYSELMSVNRSFNSMNKKIMGFIRKDISSIRDWATRCFMNLDWVTHDKARAIASDTDDYVEGKNKNISEFNVNKK